MMKRIMCLLLCATAALLVCACDNTEASSSPTQAQVQQEETVSPQTPDSVAPTEDSDTLSLKNFINTFDKAPSVDENKQIYDDDTIAVTLKEIDYTAVSGPELKLSVQNKLDKDIVVQSPYSIVNDFMITPEMNARIAASKTADCSLILPYFKLAISEITSLKKVEFALRIVDAATYNPIAATELITVETSSKKEETEYDESGQTAYDENDIKIVLKGINSDRAYSDGAELIVYMVNGTDKRIAVRAEDVIVNGYDMTSAMNSTILPDKRAVDVVTIYKLDMKEYGIEEIDSVKVSFTIKDAETWETIDSTELISVTLPEKSTDPASADEKEKQSDK